MQYLEYSLKQWPAIKLLHGNWNASLAMWWWASSPKIPDHPWKMSATWTLKACEPNHPNWASTSMDCEGVLSTTVVSWLSFPPTLALRTTSFLVSGATLRGLRGLLSSQSARTGSGIPLPARQWHLKDQKVRVLNGRNPQVLGLSSWSFARV